MDSRVQRKVFYEGVLTNYTDRHAVEVEVRKAALEKLSEKERAYITAQANKLVAGTRNLNAKAGLTFEGALELLEHIGIWKVEND